jgi:hypothetical protein
VQTVRVSVWLIATVTLLVPALGRGEEEPPPCRPARPGELMLVDLDVTAAADARSTFGARVTNHSGRMVCRVLVQTRGGGRRRPASCHPSDAYAIATDGRMICAFTAAAEAPASPPTRGGRRRREAPPASAAGGRLKVTVTGLELADVDAYQEWEARRTAPASQPASAPAAAPGFRHHVTLARASDGTAARRELDRALGRLRECVLERARKNPTLTVQATLRLSVSRARGDDGTGECLLAVKVLSPPAMAPEVRDCVRILDLVVLATGSDFSATAEVSYDGWGRPPPARVEAAEVLVRSTQPASRPSRRAGRQGMRGGRRGD